MPQIALNWLLQRPSVASMIIGARTEEQLRQNLARGLEAVGRAGRPARRGQRHHTGLSLLAPARLCRAQSAGCMTLNPARALSGRAARGLAGHRWLVEGH